jgi:CPA1 family monovalent cation:H+ antiporter
MHVIEIVLSLLLAVVVSGLVARVLPLPAPLVQIAIGALFAAFGPITAPLDPSVFFLLFLPPLLFLDGWRIPKDELARDAGTVIQLALGLVIFTVIGVGYFVHWLVPTMPLAVAFALAAIVSPTDPVAVSAIARRVPMPRRMMRILQGEALLNDASGLVCMRFAVAAALTGVFSLPAALRTFGWLLLASVAIGVAGTWLAMKVRTLLVARFGDDPGSEILVSLLLPFGLYLLAELANASGILAAATAGLTMGFVQSARMSAATRIRSRVVWDMIQFAANGVVFVLLGEQIPTIMLADTRPIQGLGALLLDVTAIVVALAALRFVWVFASLWLARVRHGRREAMPHARLVVAMSLAGVRGAVTLAGIFTLPVLLTDGTPFPSRDLTIVLAAGVIVFSLVIATLLLPPMLRGLDFAEPSREDEEDRARVIAAEAAIHAVESAASDDREATAKAALSIIDFYRERIARASQRIEASTDAEEVLANERELWLTALAAERSAVLALRKSRAIDDRTRQKLVREIDLTEARYTERPV